MAELFGIDRTVITKHLKNIFESSELEQDSVCAYFAHTAEDGKKYNTAFYNLNAIIAVGYRVNSKRATRFRQWATKILNEYIRKGFVLDDDRLKNGTKVFGKDYFRELLERVRSIRASAGYGSRSRTSMRNAVSTMTAILRRRKTFTPWCRTASASLSRDRRPRKSSTRGRIIPRNTWDLLPGRTPRTGGSSSLMYR